MVLIKSYINMIWFYNVAIPLYLLNFIVIVMAADKNTNDCIREGYNLGALASFSPWTTLNDQTNATFQISLCSKLKIDHSTASTDCTDGTAVCAHYPNGTAINYGTFEEDPSTSTKSTNAILTMVLKGEVCPQFDGEFYTTILYFKCGKTQGHPYYLGDMGCSVHFEWESYIFCKDLPVPENEVPCTVMRDGHLIDLSPLIKLTGAYLIDDAENRNIFINVCRDIKKGTDPVLAPCPVGTASCYLLDPQVGRDYGHPTQRLEATTSGAKLFYTSNTKPEGCPSNPTTTINFRCPQRGGSKDPVLVTDFLASCSIEIDWVTEYACPIDYIYSDTCQLTSAQHDVDIDLSPLKHIALSQTPYKVPVTDGKDHYIYYINICGMLGFQCGSLSGGLASVCQKKEGNDTFSRLVGSSHFMKLRYSDGKLNMIYSHGDRCHTDFSRKTFINFVCNKTADDDGKGHPTYVSNENCSYTFEWQTKYACVDHPVIDTCSVDFKGKRFDLSPLVKEHGGFWEVLVSENDESDTDYYVNICHDVLRQGPTAGCPPGSAMCAKGPNGFSNLGKYIQPVQYDESSNSLKLVYTEGDKTGNKCARSTTINFYCLPGVLDNAPILVHKSMDGCYHEVEWHTAAACVLSQKTGDGCKVVDAEAGLTFDLNPLKSKNSSYKVEVEKYTYYINVCDEIKDKNNPCADSPHSKAAICQVDKADTTNVEKIAEPATHLQYYDGILNLTYIHGEPYNNPKHTERMAEIAFECDMTEGKGHPEFMEEKDFTYAFKWRTSYACPVPPIECAVVDTKKNLQYDLSSLSKATENWVWIEGDTSKQTRQKFYINVCRPLAKSSHMPCSFFASVCVSSVDQQGKESLLHGNLGRLAGSPQLEKSSTGVKIVYTNGNDCEANGIKKKFTTTVHFFCAKGKLTGKPSKPVLIRPCEYSILWETAAACPVGETPSDTGPEQQGHSGNCTVKDPNSDFMFNLKPLAKFGDEYYNVKSSDGKTSYKLNICGSLSESVCGKFDSDASAVCEGSTPVAMLTSDLSYSSTGELTLEYRGKTDLGTGMEKKYTFNFFCDRTAQRPVVKFESQGSMELVFHINTALACSPQPVECTVQDNFGRQFDLSSLALKDRNWVVPDGRQSHPNLKYHINVCRPVNPTAEMTCPGGAVGACQTGDSSYNMGYVQSKPVVANNGTAISMVYQGGDVCHRGKPNQAHRSTRIIFTCSDVDHEPVFLSESDTCEYSFVWETPSACPQHSTMGADCKVKEQLYDFEFDLTPLHKTSENYVVKGSEYNFILNVCGPLVASSTGCTGDNVGACQTGGGLSSPVELGKSNSKVIYDSGELRLVYTEGKANCHGKFTRKVIIRFNCDASTSGDQGPTYVEETSECIYEFVWNTRHACPPYQVKDCTFHHDNKDYDLTALEKVDENYETTKLNSKYILNVCHSLVHKKGQTCPFDAAACEIDLQATDEKKRYHSLGDVRTMTFALEQNKLVLRYTNGEMCDDGKTKMSTQITFDCDLNSDALGVPNSHFKVNGCENHFLWTSRAACPLVKTGDDDVAKKDFGNCRVKNPQTGYWFDLSSLKQSGGYKTTDREGHMYALNVCDGLDTTSGCSNGTGVCQTGIVTGGDNVSAGKANANLIFRDGVLALKYTAGESCRSGTASRSTIINFVCMPKAGKGLPVYVDKSDDCIYYFDWHTDLVCETQITCAVKTETSSTLDFSPLVQHSGKYHVLLNDVRSNASPASIYLNLCRPLNPVFGILCPPGSGACLVRDGQKPLSLGHVHEDLVYDAITKEVRLTYSHGDACPSNPKINTSSVIILKCSQNNYFKDPELDTITSDCTYMFVWMTPYACQINSPMPYSACSFYDTKDNVIHDLSALTEEMKVPSAHGGIFTIRACGHFDEKGEKGDASCSQAAVCLAESKGRDGSYGAFSQASVKAHTDTKAITFTGGKSCKSGGHDMKASSTIHFKCSSSAGNGEPVIIDDGDCGAVFEWPTNAVCPPVRKECITTDHGSLFDFSLLSQDTGSWNYTDTKGNIFWINLCQGVHGKALQSKCPHNAAVCMKAKDGTAHMLGDVNTQTITATGTKDDKTFLLQYTNGDMSICSRGRRRRSDDQPSVIISLKCADTIGAPVFEKHDEDKCVYEFSWKTRMACATSHSPAPVKEKAGLITDQRSGKTIDLNSLLRPGKNTELTVGDQRYLVNLKGQLNLDAEPADANVCTKATICHYSGKTKKYRNLGAFSQKAYYLLDEQLEVKFTSPTKCAGTKSTSYISSTVIFECVHNKTQHGLEFLYHTSDCAFVFMWKTDVVCIQGAAITDTDRSVDNNSHKASNGGSVNSTKIAVGVCVFLAIAIACILVLVLHKPERRAAVKFGLKRCILCRRRNEPRFSYSMLSQSAEGDDNGLRDNDLDISPFNPFDEPDDEAEINNGHLPSNIGTYHDDSDEDILL